MGINTKNQQYEIVEYETALEKTKEYFNGDELAANVWINKYALRDSHGNIYEETPTDMHNRIADEFYRIENKYVNPMSRTEIFDLLDKFKYIIPQGSPMFGIGNKMQTISLSNCFVIGQGKESDSYGSIMKTDEEQVQLMKRRGGVGHDLSHLRPNGSPVYNSAITSTGVVPFMERYSNSTREVAQDGRRGALMLSISIKHPEAENFIDAKLEQKKVTGANISVKIDDTFMKAAVYGNTYRQQYPIDAPEPKMAREIDASLLWKKIIHNAWQSAEPGVLFWDTIIRESIPDCYADKGYGTVSTNPCGEIPLCPYDSCRLMAINLYSYVINPFTPYAKFDLKLFKNHCNKAMRLMDDLIDLEIEKIEAIIKKIKGDPESDKIKATELDLWVKIREKTIGGRRSGLGITGEGDMMAALGLSYGSKEATLFAVSIHKTLCLEAYRSSVVMAQERGGFWFYDSEKEKDNPMILRIREADDELYQKMIKVGRRNISMLTIAPTGTTSLMTQTTSGIEPAFRVFYKRRKKINPSEKQPQKIYIDEMGDCFEEFKVFHKGFLTWMEVNGYDTSDIYNLSEEKINEYIAASPYHKSTANDINWLDKVTMQGAIQKWIDHSISVTVNLPSDTTETTVGDVYQRAWYSGCKGVTVYRDGCRDGILIASPMSDTEKKDKPSKRPKSLKADVVRFKNDKEEWVAFVGINNNMPYEIFTGKINNEEMYIPSIVKTGYIIKIRDIEGSKHYDFQYKDENGTDKTIYGISKMFNKEYWNYAKLISGILRHQMPIDKVVTLIKSLELDDQSINTWKNGVERTLKKYIKDGTLGKEKCPQCGELSMVYQNGCLTCMSCGYSKCS